MTNFDSFGANEWLVDEMFEKYQQDPNSVDKTWWDFFKDYSPQTPTGKPIPLFSNFVEKFTDRGNIILDPFMGSGTTGVAAIQMGRKFIGIERESKYFDIACKRIEQTLAQLSLFEDVKLQMSQETLL